MTLIFVDCEAWGPGPRTGVLTEFGAVEYNSRSSFHGIIYDSKPDPENPAVPMRPDHERDLVEPSDEVFRRFEAWLMQFPKPWKMVSDNPAFDFQWIADGSHSALGYCVFGHSARRIGDFYAGLSNDFFSRQDWKSLRETPHDHNPVNDAMGNVEAFEKLMRLAFDRRLEASERDTAKAGRVPKLDEPTQKLFQGID